VNGGVCVGHGQTLDLVQVFKLNTAVGEGDQIESTGLVVKSKTVLFGLECLVNLILALLDLFESVLQLFHAQVKVRTDYLFHLFYLNLVCIEQFWVNFPLFVL